jgi:hexokinase
LLDWPPALRDDPVVLHAAEDGSGVGAAVVAALTLQRVRAGCTAGVRNPELMMK